MKNTVLSSAQSECTYSNSEKALVIARFRVQYDQYFPNFPYFADLFHQYTSKIKSKNEKGGKYWQHCMRQTFDK